MTTSEERRSWKLDEAPARDRLWNRWELRAKSRSSYDFEGLNADSASGFVEVLGKLKCPQFLIFVRFLSPRRYDKFM